MIARNAHASANVRPAVMLFSPERGRILSGERGEHAPLDLLDRPEPGDSAIARRAGLAALGPAPVVVDERARLRAIDFEALPHRFLAVVVSLEQRLAGHIVFALRLRRIELDVVGAPRRRMHAAAAHTHDDLVVGHVDLEHAVERHAGALERLRLRDGARKAVEEIAALAVGLLQPLLHETDDDVVGHELPGVHHLLRREAKRRAGLHRGAQHVTGRNLRDAVLLADEVRLRAFAGAGRAEKYHPHRSILRTAARSSGVSTPGGISASLTTTAMRCPYHSARNCSSASLLSSGAGASAANCSRKPTR